MLELLGLHLSSAEAGPFKARLLLCRSVATVKAEFGCGKQVHSKDEEALIGLEFFPSSGIFGGHIGGRLGWGHPRLADEVSNRLSIFLRRGVDVNYCARVCRIISYSILRIVCKAFPCTACGAELRAQHDCSF